MPFRVLFEVRLFEMLANFPGKELGDSPRDRNILESQRMLITACHDDRGNEIMTIN